MTMTAVLHHSSLQCVVCRLVILCGVAVASAAAQGGGEGRMPHLTLQRRSSSGGLEEGMSCTRCNQKGHPQVKKTRHGF